MNWISRYASMPLKDVIYEYAVTRGDLVEEYAREQLLEVIEDRMFTRLLDRTQLYEELVAWVDRLLQTLDASPDTAQLFAQTFSPLAWIVDHISEARHALETGAWGGDDA